MNIFLLDWDIKKCAEYTCDAHVVKMITETAQILCTSYHYTGQGLLSPYNMTHELHPIVKWVNTSIFNWLWLRELGLELYVEYYYRFGKRHKAGDLILDFKLPELPDIGFSIPPICVPEEYKVQNDIIESYRNFYRYDKVRFAKWTKRNIPYWMEA